MVMEFDDFLILINGASLQFMPTGSRFTCDPPPINTDIDYLMLASRSGIKKIVSAGFKMEGHPEEYADAPQFNSYRNGEYNIIATSDADFYELFKIATFTAKKRNILDKKKRIKLFREILYGEK